MLNKMMRRKVCVKFERSNKNRFAYVGVVVGAGFSTGQEVMKFLLTMVYTDI